MVSPDALFGGFIVIFVAAFTLIIKVAVDFGVMKTKIKAAHKRLDKLNGLESDED